MFKKVKIISKSSAKYARKIVIWMLVGVILATHVLPTVAYAQEAQGAAPKKEAFTTLATDTEAPETLPFTGEGHGVKSIIPAMADLQASNVSAGFVETARVRKLAKENYRPNEEIDLVIENGVHKEFKTELIDAIGNKVALDTQEVESGATKVITLEQPSSFRPGKFTLRVSDNRGGISEQNFSWGVLAVNPDKSIYAPKETASLAIGVLDEGGNMVCDAQVELQITDPSGGMTSLSTDNRKILVNEECKSHDFTLKPDYETAYTVGAPGVYKMLLKSQTKNGAFSINDSFEVRAAVPFDVKRISATRIYPPNTYPVTLEITANQDFEGTVAETVPASFKIGAQGEEIKTDNQKIDAIIGASESAAVKAPDSLPKSAPIIPNNDVITFNTVNNLQEGSAVKAVLGASIPGMGMPFSGSFPITQDFGESLVNDIHDHDLYESFGMHGHDGIDFAMPVGTTLIAVDAGKVLLAGPGDYGTTIVLQHSWGRSYYGHLSGVSVKAGDEVIPGQTIGQSGNTGISTGPHLHFGIKPDTNDEANGYYGKVDPAYYLGMKQTAAAVLGASTKFDESIGAAPTTDVQILTWKVSVKKGDKIKLGYNYLAPRISPQFYTLGPATFTDTTGNEVFHEIRKWQIASDALDYKFKRGTFQKSTCTATCTQTVAGVGFKPKAVIFEWSSQTAEGFNAHSVTGMGFATNNSAAIQERSALFCAQDASATTNTLSRRSDTKVIMMFTTDCGSGVSPAAQADFVSMDSDGFTISWTSNDANPYIIHYTAIGGSDVSNAKVGTFTLTTGTGSLSSTDPGFQPDFTMFLGTTNTAVDTNPTAGTDGRMNIGFASSPTKEAAVTLFSDDGAATTESTRQQSTTASILLLSSTGTQDAIADLTSFDSTGFTLNKSDAPAANTDIFYLAIQGGQYDVGSFTQPTSNGEQSVYTGFRPSGLMTLAASTSATATIQTTGAALSTGGASRDNAQAWCNDRTGVTCTAAGIASTSNNSDWCNDTTGVTCGSDWSTRKKITINNASSSADLTDFPILVKLDSTRIDYSKTQNSGQDLRFVDPTDKTTVLPHEVELWNESGISYVWVKVPQLDANNAADYIWMYYGNATAPSGQDANNVWDSSYSLVQHLEETSACGTSIFTDSTVNANTGSCSGSGPTVNGSGKIGGARAFNGTSQNISITNHADFNPGTAAFSIEAWVNTNTASSYQAIMSHFSSQGWQFYIDFSGGTCANGRLCFYDGSTDQGVVSGLGINNWKHVAIVRSGTTGTFYVNGVRVGSITVNASIPTTNTDVHIGQDGSNGGFWSGSIDEVRYSLANRSEDWIEASYLTQNDQTNTYGSEQLYSAEQSSSGWAARKKITLNNVPSTEDLENFPVLVTLNASRIDYNKTQNAGQDIRFVDPNDPNTVLPHEIDTWNESGTSYVWVKVPKIDRLSNTDFLWMYYGNASASDGQDPANVWDSNYRAVWHTKETSGSSVADSTANANKGALVKGAVITSSGKIGAANDYDGINDAMFASPSASLNNLTTQGGGGMTVSGWVNVDVSTNGTWGQLAIKAASAAPSTGWLFEVIGTGNQWDLNQTTSAGNVQRVGTTTFTDDVWTFFTATYNGSGTATNVRIYVNGVESVYGAASNGAVVSDDSAQFFASGCDVPATGNNCLNGMIDELRVSNVIRSSEWVEAEYRSMNDTMNIFGTEETQAGGSQSYAQGSIWSDDIDNIPDSNNATSSRTDTVVQFATSPTGTGASRTLAKANLQSLDGTGFTLNWSESDANARQVLYWAVGSVTATQEDYRWYKNANSLTPDVALEDENSSTILAKNKPYARLRASLSTGGNGLNASSQGFKLQYASNQPEAAVGGTTDWCNDTTGVTCTAPVEGEVQGGTPTDWCNDTTGATCTSDWSSRRKITFNNASSSAALTDFPVLVKLDSTRIDYSKTQNNGEDIRFVDANAPTVALNHEIETWNESGSSYVWVKVPSIDGRSNTDSIWMYYGNSTVGSPATQLGNTTHATGVWDSSFKSIWHLSESGDHVGTDYADSTTTANAGQGGGGTSSMVPTQTTGKIGNGQNFDGTDDSIGFANTTLFDATAPYTLDLWIKPDDCGDTSGQGTIYKKVAVVELGLCATGGAATEAFHYYHATGTAGYSSPGTINYTTWQHLVSVYDGSGTVKMYVNGVQVLMADVTVTEANTAGASVLGQDVAAGTASNFNYDGLLDEVRISDTIRSGDWIDAEYRSGNDTFNSYGSEFSYAETQQASTGWQYRKKITFNNASSSAALTDFPVLVKLDSSKIDYNKTQDDGGDIRFVDPSDRTTVLNHEIESWNENGVSYVWVKVPQIDAASTNDYIYMYYGNPGVADGQNATGVWDSFYTAVWHLKENPATTCESTQEVCDSTANNTNGDANGTMTSSNQVTGKVDGSLTFDGVDDYIDFGNITAVNSISNITVSGWLRRTSVGAEGFIGKTSASFNDTLGIEYFSDGQAYFDLSPTAGNANGAVPLNDTNWHFLTLVFDGSQSGNSNRLKGYVDGIQQTLTFSGTVPSTTTSDTSSFTIAKQSTAFSPTRADEVRVATTTRSPSWVTAEYLSQTDQMNLYGPEQAYTTDGTAVAGWMDVADVWCNDASGVTCNTSWSNRKRITINNQSSTTALTNFPVLVKLDASKIDYGKTQNDGDDIRFVDPADPTVVLDYEIETWNESGESLVWVEVPTLDANSTIDSIWMYYGNTSASNGENVTGVWDSDFMSVWHLKESGNGTANEYNDSTSTNNDGRGGNGTAGNTPTRATGKVGYAQDFDGSNDYINMPNNTALFSTATAYTIEFWMRPDDCAESDTSSNPFSKIGVADVFFCENIGDNDIGIFMHASTTAADSANGVVTMSNWNHVVIQHNGSGTIAVYINGALVAMDDATITTGNAAGQIALGTDTVGASTFNYEGLMDEVRVSDVARSSDWVKAEYLTSADQMNTFGNEESQTSAAWKFKDNSGVSNDTTITTSVLGSSATGNQQTYQEANPTKLIPTSLAAGEKREWDFSLDASGASNRRTYYFRIVNADGTPLTNYTRYPSITVSTPNQKAMRGGKFFNYKQEQPFTF